MLPLTGYLYRNEDLHDLPGVAGRRDEDAISPAVQKIYAVSRDHLSCKPANMINSPQYHRFGICSFICPRGERDQDAGPVAGRWNLI